MSEIHKFLFDGLPLKGAIVRLDDSWQEVLRRRAANKQTGAYATPVAELLGEMLAAGCLMQSAIKFNGALVLQMQSEGAVKLAVAEVQNDMALRATATVQGEVAADASLPDLMPQGQCAVTLDPPCVVERVMLGYHVVGMKLTPRPSFYPFPMSHHLSSS